MQSCLLTGNALPSSVNTNVQSEPDDHHDLLCSPLLNCDGREAQADAQSRPVIAEAEHGIVLFGHGFDQG